MTKIEALYNEWKSLQPIREEDANRLHQKFMLEFNYNSNHLEGNTLTYGQTELLLLFGKVVDAANMKDLEDMKASNVGLKMMEKQASSEYPLTETFIRQLHKTILREDYKVYKNLPGGQSFSYTVHAGVYKTRPNSVITQTGERFEYASPEETPSLMTDLINWYREAEESGKYTLAEMCALFHYRYIRIHPFEDGNGRIARLLVNYILAKHDYPMIVVKSSDKENYLNALSTCDGFVGTAPSEGAQATIEQIRPFVSYIEMCMERSLNTCIRAAKGQSIEEDEDFIKELKILERQKKQDFATEQSQTRFSEEEVWNVLEFVYFPLVEKFEKAIKAVNEVFHFTQSIRSNYLSKTQDYKEGLQVNNVQRKTTDPQLLEYVKNSKSMWYVCEIINPMHPKHNQLNFKKKFYVTFFEDHYFVDGILNKNFAYGAYPTTEERKAIVRQFKDDLLDTLKKL
ncbi:Fic family protein [Pseudoprevotella muciniphila]|uniref:Fic family protein n=1 Tax=Pseudoprevotella muciniphila TaxID=2133944 RepID=A0A5P8E9C1_9BACT|nr:Fic family protein [Pseudoprevotella muciniphila]QFQ13544.1 Fic family protein [Pseudoprevotella muciniphila]